MNSEKEFKDKLKEKLNSKEFQFDEANWQQARQLIDASREEKKRGILPYVLFGLLFIGSGIAGFYIMNTPGNSADKRLVISSINTQTTESKKVAFKTETAQPALKENNETKHTTIARHSKETKSTETLSTAEKTNKKRTTPVNHSGKKTNKKENISQPKNIATITHAEKKSRKQKDPGHIKTSEKKTQIANEEGSEINEQEIKEIENPSLTNNDETVKNPDPEIAITNTVKADPLVEDKSATSVRVDSVAKPLAAENPSINPVHFISIEAGTNYLFGWNNPGKKDANGFNPVIGLNYSNVIARQTILSFGIQYTMVRNLSYSNYEVTTTKYNFGEENDVMVFTPTTMHYLVAPVRVSYAFDQKNVFGLACNVGYLFNLNSNVELYSQHSGMKGNSTILKTSGYTQGFKTFDTQLAVFYKRNLMKDLWLHTEFMYGLTDVKDNAFFKSNVNERNIGLKMTLIYNLFKK